MIPYLRIFRVEGGPLAQAIKDVTAERMRIGEQYVEFGAYVGCKQVHTWPWTGRFAGCTFDKGHEPSLADWRLSHRMWVPRKKTQIGAALWDRANALDPLPAIQNVLEPYGLQVHKPLIGSTPCFVEGFGHVGVYFVTVPWFDVGPQMLEMAKAIDDKLPEDMQFVTTWQVPNDWVEVQPFQKLIEWDELDRK